MQDCINKSFLSKIFKIKNLGSTFSNTKPQKSSFKKFNWLLVFKNLIISALLAFIFWLGFFGVVLQESLETSESHSIFYTIVQYVLAVVLIGFFGWSAGFSNLKGWATRFSIKSGGPLDLEHRLKKQSKTQTRDSNNHNEAFPLQSHSHHVKAFFTVKNWLSTILFILPIILLSLLHKNPYFLSSIGYLIAVAIFLFLPRYFRFFFGFFVGVFGFYWISLSFRFENLAPLIPLGILAIGLIYAIIFYFLLFFENLIFRFFSCLSLFFIAPLSFNWLNLTYFSAYTIFHTFSLPLIMISLIFWHFGMRNSECKKDFKKDLVGKKEGSKLKKIYCILAFIFLLLSLDFDFSIKNPRLHAFVAQTHYTQDMKWLLQSRQDIINENLKIIENAIDSGFELVILPESTFPFVLNRNENLYKKLLDLSHKIIIIAGALRVQDPKKDLSELQGLGRNENVESNMLTKPTNNKPGFYNSAYIFISGKSIVADKIELVPFGETLPFNDIFEFFGINFGFNKGSEVVKFSHKSGEIAIANCFEGTMSLPYKSGADYIIMMSNNAWFAPSTQDVMQKMIIKYYARLYDVFVYHSTNLSPKAIISPNVGDL